MKKDKKLKSQELTSLIIDLPSRGHFTVSTPTERGLANTIARTLRQAGRIEFQVTSRKTDSGFMFFIVPAT
jgi:hypothetical protein